MGHLILEIQFVFLQIVFFPCSFLKPGMIGNKYYIAIKDLLLAAYSHLFNKCGGLNERGGGAKVAKSLNVEVGINVEGGKI